MKRYRRYLRGLILLSLLGWGLMTYGASAPSPALAAGPDDISGTVFLDMNWNGLIDGGEFGLSGITVQLITPGGATSQTTTAGDGTYSLTTAETGQHTLNVQTPAGYTATASPSYLVDKTSGQAATGNNVGLQLQSVASPTPTVVLPGVRPSAISGFVYHDMNGNARLDQGEPPVVGVSVKLEGAKTGTTQSDATGYYVFADLPNGLYSVSADWAAIQYRPLSDAVLVANITPGVGFSDRNFGGQPLPATPTPTPTSMATSIPTTQPTHTPEPTAVPINTGACTVKSEPARTPAGQDVTFIGAGFGQNEAAAIGLVFPDGSVVGLPAQATSNAGSFAFTYHTEEGDPVGLYTLVAEGQTGHCRGSGAFYLDEAAVPTPVSVVITSPTDGSYGVGGGGPLMLGSIPVPQATEVVDPAVVAASSDPFLTHIELRSFTEVGGEEQASTEQPELPGLGGGSLLPLRVIGTLVVLGLIVLVAYLLMSGSMVARWAQVYLKGGSRRS